MTAWGEVKVKVKRGEDGGENERRSKRKSEKKRLHYRSRMDKWRSQSRKTEQGTVQGTERRKGGRERGREGEHRVRSCSVDDEMEQGGQTKAKAGKSDNRQQTRKRIGKKDNFGTLLAFGSGVGRRTTSRQAGKLSRQTLAR